MTNRVPWTTKEAPGTLVNQWTSTKGTKGTTVVVVVASLRWPIPHVIWGHMKYYTEYS